MVLLARNWLIVVLLARNWLIVVLLARNWLIVVLLARNWLMGGGKGIQAFHFGKKDYELGVGGEGQYTS